MRSILKSCSALLVMLFSLQTLQAQDFPATEAEVKELLCKKWSAKSISMGANQMDASAMGLSMDLIVNPDGTYSMNFMGDEMKGTWKTELDKKRVVFFNEDGKEETLLTSLKKEEITIMPAEEEEQEMKMIMVPAPK